jgi:hypothetical protein
MKGMNPSRRDPDFNVADHIPTVRIREWRRSAHPLAAWSVDDYEFPSETLIDVALGWEERRDPAPAFFEVLVRGSDKDPWSVVCGESPKDAEQVTRIFLES